MCDRNGRSCPPLRSAEFVTTTNRLEKAHSLLGRRRWYGWQWRIRVALVLVLLTGHLGEQPTERRVLLVGGGLDLGNIAFAIAYRQVQMLASRLINGGRFAWWRLFHGKILSTIQLLLDGEHRFARIAASVQIREQTLLLSYEVVIADDVVA